MNTFRDFFSQNAGKTAVISSASTVEQVSAVSLNRIAENNFLPVLLDKLFPVQDYWGQFCRRIFINRCLSPDGKLSLEEYFKFIQASDFTYQQPEKHIQIQWRDKTLLELLQAGESDFAQTC